MFDFHEKRKFRHLIYSKPVIILLAVVVVMLANAVWGIFQKERETAEKKAERKTALKEIEKRNTDLKHEIERLNSATGVEAELREKFNVAKEGERVIVIVDPEVENRQNDKKSRGFFARVRDFFGF